jgi:gluconokinase
VTEYREVSQEEAADPLVLTVDVGSSSVRASVSDARGRPVSEWVARRKYSLDAPTPGAAQADAAVLVQLVEACIDELVESFSSRGRTIAAVTCATFWHSVMGVAADGSPTTPVFTWADTRSVRESNELRETLDPRATHNRTGAGLYANYLPAKLLWLSREDSASFHRSRWWMSFGEYLYFRLFGERRVSVSMASGTGMLNQRECVWDDVVLNSLPIDVAQLSPVFEFSDSLTGLPNRLAEKWPILRNAPWYLAVGDGAANNIGSGGTNPDTAVVMIGTSGAIRLVREADSFDVPEGLWTYRVDMRRIVQGGAMSAGGNVFAWLTNTVRNAGAEELETALSQIAPDSHGLTVLPFLAGERSPGWLADARATVTGMTISTTPAEIARATLEAVTYRFSLVFSLLTSEISQVRGIIGSGVGLLHSPAWMEIMTDVLGRPMTASAVEEATCRGAALLALESMGEIHDLASLPIPAGKTYHPNRENTELYARAIERQEKLYALLLT